MGRRTWVKLHCLPWLDGGIAEAPIAIRGTFVTLICLVGDCRYADDGELKPCKTTGYPDDLIATMLHIDPRTWLEHKTYLQKPPTHEPWIEISEANVIKVVDWAKFQPDFRRYKAKSHSSTMTSSHSLSHTKQQSEIKIKKEIKEKTTTLSAGDHPTGEEFRSYWNEKSQLTKSRTWGPERERKLRGLRARAEFRENWMPAVDALCLDEYAIGKGWATIDIFLSNDSHKNSNWNKAWEKYGSQLKPTRCPVIPSKPKAKPEEFLPASDIGKESADAKSNQ